ncbi:hypothetical protein FEK35_21715 [Nocardia cyriacigeorgica]|uniref:DUF5666 domain-containing protein n=1 Tax=Nocardia cyriacigeorgica TaxID=135487 RepID=A0A5R8P9X0_9NOCA|nr:DUF5666 domain-containing protein [Nocardia cyriacigeorgica]TLG03261.1 hypothetical protein FEK35_21715 [Nocardia cyriacigeorgica]
MTNPNDPWGQRPDDSPTEHLGPPGGSGTEPLHTTEYTEAYGPTAYPGGDQYEPWKPPSNPTRELPTYDSQWGGYEGQQWQPPTQPTPDPAAMGDLGAMPPSGEPPRPPKRNTGLWIGLGLAVVLLIAVAGAVAGLLFGGGDSSPSASDTATSSLPTAGRTPNPTPGPSTPPLVIPSLPGIEGIDGIGATMGTITANNAGTLTVSSIGGATVTVTTDANTQVISLSGGSPADLPTGELVVVQGDKAPDGSIHAKIIISTALPGGGR